MNNVPGAASEVAGPAQHAEGGTVQTQFRFVTWNMRYTTSVPNCRARWDFLLNDIQWDVLALQEVSDAAWRYFLAQESQHQGFCTLDSVFELPAGSHKRPGGVALLARHGFTLDRAALIPDYPDIALPELRKPERGLFARLDGLAEPVTVVSWHAPHAADGQWRTKYRAYQVLTRWLETREGPVVLGCDANNWDLRLDLARPNPPKAESHYRWQNLFFSCRPTHRLRDAFVDYLGEHPDEYDRARLDHPAGPLAITHIRGNQHKRTADRFDYILMSPELRVTECDHEFLTATSSKVGSDHGTVAATLQLG